MCADQYVYDDELRREEKVKEQVLRCNVINMGQI